MAERKDTNPFSLDDSSSNPHLPPSAYQPNPFPINPTEGNPWAASQNDYQPSSYQGHSYNNSSSSQSYGHGYNTSSDSGSQSVHPTYIPMPSPSTYKYNNSYNFPNNAYSNTGNAYGSEVNTYEHSGSAYGSEVNAYEHSGGASQPDNNAGKDEYDNNTTELDYSATIANPGIETSDPDKLKISSQVLETPSRTPNILRLLSRFIQFIASAGAFALMISAYPATKQNRPENINEIAIIFLYIVSCVSIIYSFGHLIFYCLRRWGSKNKAPRLILILIDAIIGASFGTLMVFLIKGSNCKPGGSGGWCDFYNSSIFFTVLAFVTYAISFIWDIVGGFKRS